MAAVVQIHEKTGASTGVDKTSPGIIRFKDAIDTNVDTNNPLVIPDTGSVFSYEKWLQANLGGTFTEVSNLRAYFDGTNNFGTGINLWYKNGTATYSTPVKPAASTGYTDAFTLTSGAPFSAGAGPFTTTGYAGNHLVLVMEVASTASQGVTPTETLTWAWDEI